jgi:hypothetical protein
MSEPIKVGDLVQVIHQCCALDSELGSIFVISRIEMRHGICPGCGYTSASAFEPMAMESGCPGHVPVKWLKRIPDFPELADERHDEEITA